MVSQLNSPARWVQSAGHAPLQVLPGQACLAAEARVATPYAPIAAGRLKPGHRVLTVDGGAQSVRWVGHARVAGQGIAAPVHVPASALGALSPLRLSQQHLVLIASAEGEALFGTAEVLVPVPALIGHAGIRLVPCDVVTYVHILLDDHHLIRAEGVHCESLFLGAPGSSPCDVDACLLPDGYQSAIRHSAPARKVLSLKEARDFLAGVPWVNPVHLRG